MPDQSSLNTSTENKTRCNVYLEDSAKNGEAEVAELLSEEGYLGMYKSNGTPNRSAIVNALYYIMLGKYDKIPRK